MRNYAIILIIFIKLEDIIDILGIIWEGIILIAASIFFNKIKVIIPEGEIK